MANIITDLQRGTTAFNNIETKLKSKGVIGPAEVVPVEDYPDRIDDIVPSLGTKIIDKNGTYDASDDNIDGYSSVDVKVENSAYNLWNTVKRIMEASEAIKEDGTNTRWSNVWNSDSNNKVHVLVNNITAGKVALLSGHNGSVTYNDNKITLQLGNITFNANIYIDLSDITDYIEEITIRSWNSLNIANIIIIDSLSYPLCENDVVINIGTDSNTMQLDYGIHLFRANSLTTQDLKLPDKSIPVNLYGTFNGDDINIAPIFDLKEIS